MKSLFTVILASACVSVAGCKKEENEKNPFSNHSYQTGNTLTVSPVRIFTMNGEIPDSLIKRRFAENTLPLPLPFLFTTNSQTIAYTKFKISFSDNNTATIERYPQGTAPPAVNSETHTVKYQLLGNETMKQEESASSQLVDYTQKCQTLFDKMLNFPQVKNCIPAGPSPPSCSCLYKKTYQLRVNGDQLTLPILNGMVKSGELTMRVANVHFSYLTSGIPFQRQLSVS